MLIFHAGPHKTATSYLQENLSRARDELKKRGWCYPRQGTGGAAAHHGLIGSEPDWLQEGSPGQRELKKVRQEHNLVFSTEGAARWGPERYHALADLLGRDRIDVVYTLRDPIDLFQSHWIEQIKQGQTMGLGECMAKHFADPWSSNLLNPLPVLQALVDDRRIRLHAIPFQPLKERGIDIYTHFCAAVLGLDGMVPSKTEPRNVALPILQTEFLRLITLLAADGERRIGSTLRHRFIAKTTDGERRALGQLIRKHGQAARRMVRFPAPHPFKCALEEQLRDALGTCWTQEPSPDRLFRHEPQEYVYYNAFELLLSPEIAAAAEQMLSRLAAGGSTVHGLRSVLTIAKKKAAMMRRAEPDGG